MLEIRSETARLTRESAVGLPYHKPKQKSLEEFLNRKKGAPDLRMSLHAKRFDASVDKIMAEREKKLKEFYKSDSEEEKEEDGDADDADYRPNNNTGTTDDIAAEEFVADSAGKSEGNYETEKEETAGNGDQVATDITAGYEADKLDEKLDGGKCVQDSGILSGLATSDESNENTDEEFGKPPLSLKLASSPSHEVFAEDCGEEVSLKLVLEPETPALEEEERVEPSQGPLSKAWAKLQALKSKFGDSSSLDQTLNVKPTLSSGVDDDLIFNEDAEKSKLSTGAQKLFDTFFKHTKMTVQSKMNKDSEEPIDDIKIVSKKFVDGKEILLEESIQYSTEKKSKNPIKQPVSSLIRLKSKLRKELMEKKRETLTKKAEIMKLNNEAYDEPEEEEMEYDDEEEIYEDEDYDVVEEEEESEPEENDVDMREKKRRKNDFVEDEAEDDDELFEDKEEDDNDSIVHEIEAASQRKFRKIVDPDLLSDNSNASDIFTRLDRIRSDAETPTLTSSKTAQNSAPSSNNSLTNLLTAEPRWTPFQVPWNSDNKNDHLT